MSADHAALCARLREPDDSLVPRRNDKREAADAIESLVAERDAAVSALRVLNEETVLAGYPGGDRDVTLANVRQMRADLLELDYRWRDAARREGG